MADFESWLRRWQAAGAVDEQTAAQIRAHEALAAAKADGAGEKTADAGQPVAAPAGAHTRGPQRQVHVAGVDTRGPRRQVHGAGADWQGITAMTLGAILSACGVLLFVSVHWNELGPGVRFALVCAMVVGFHLAGALARANDHGFSTALHAAGTIVAGPAIALTAQIFSVEEPWPGAVLLWALAALAGWMLLRDQAQQTLALLLAPAWIFSELWIHVHGTMVNDYIGADVYVGRLLFVWAVLYLTFFLNSRRKTVKWILFAGSVVVSIIAIGSMLEGWSSWSSTQSFIPFGTRVWAWFAIAGVPLIVAAFHGHKGLIPVTAAIAFVIALPWCYQTWTEHLDFGAYHANPYTLARPNIVAYAMVASFAVFLCWWGMHLASRALANLGVLEFAIVVVWFYSSDVMSKMSRSLGLIGLGVVFLAGGWALEKMRRRILAGIESSESARNRSATGAR